MSKDLQKIEWPLDAECGKINIRIDSTGQWHHEGLPIRRIEIVRLFATLLKKDIDGIYWLETPVEKIYVGPGLNEGFESQPSGGFHPDTRDYAMPRTTDELRVKTNPKQSFEGRILPGQGIAKRGQFSKMRKNNPDRFYIQGSDRLMKTTGAVKGKKLRAPIIDKHTNRQDTSCKNYAGPAGSVERKKAPKPGLFRKSRNHLEV